MTFLIEATKGDLHTTDIRSTGIVAVILARKLSAEGFEVSIRSPSGRLYLAGEFNLLLTGERLDSKESPTTARRRERRRRSPDCQ